MRLTVDTDAQTLEVTDSGGRRTVPLYSPEGFEALTSCWIKVGWNQKYTYSFTWLGRPVIQLPEDLLRLQEVVWRLRPDVIVETGVAHGGSLVFHASLCRLAGHGRVIGVDVEIRPHNRTALEDHPLADLITLVEGDSVSRDVVTKVESLVAGSERCLVVLDAAHDRAHVRDELEVYSPFVTSGSYVVVADGVMRALHDVPRGQPSWADDNPLGAVDDFLATHPEFVRETPVRPFDETLETTDATYWPGGWLRRL